MDRVHAAWSRLDSWSERLDMLKLVPVMSKNVKFVFFAFLLAQLKYT